MGAHTPGPWHATSSGEGLPLTRIGYAMRGLGGGYDSHCIALMSVEQRDDEVVSANAQLIAAAPDLLEAGIQAAGVLQGCASILESLDNPRTAERVRDAADRMLRALGKAVLA